MRRRRHVLGIAALVALVAGAIALALVLRSTGTTASSDPFQPRQIPGDAALEKISRDPLTNPQNQHEGAVEPTLARSGKSLVVVYQVARRNEGGAAALIGFAVSHDGGRRWTSGFLPGLTTRSRPAGRFGSATDPSVAYDRRYRTWLALSYVLASPTLPFATLLVNRSADGLSWKKPRPVLGRNERVAVDKPWVVCDNSARSVRFGTCYSAFNAEGEGIAVQSTADGGRSWSKPVVAARTDLVGAIPFVQADGTLAVVMRRPGQIVVTRSSNGGRTFAAPVAVGPERLTGDEESGGDPYPLRAPAIPSVSADSAGTMYVAWPECGGAHGCSSTDILISSSRDGRTWSRPLKAVTSAPGVFALLPAVASDSAPGAPPRRLALVYYVLRPSTRSLVPMLAWSADAGTTWTRAPLTRPPERLGWLAQAGSTPFIGDYVGITLHDGSAVAALTVSRKPTRRRLRQGIYVARSG